MDIYCGIDFGTTNTVVSISSRTGAFIDSFSIPTTLFIPFENQGITKVIIGYEALHEYECGKPGRYIHSIKRSLSDRYLKHTTINRTYVKLEELICLFLIELKEIIFRKWCINPANIVLGRPVKFSTDESADILANERLLRGFKLAGFKNIVQLEEPVAASLCFEDVFSQTDSRFLIIDLGGGTSDYSLVKRDPEEQGIKKYTIESIDGIDIGGDNFDEEIMYSRLAPVLGIHSTFDSFDKRMPMPTHIYRDVCKWNAMHLFDKKTLGDDFADYLYRSDDPLSIHKLRAIIENKLSHQILDKVRKSKHVLSENKSTTIRYDGLNLNIDVPLSREQFSEILSPKIDSVIGVMNKMMGENQKLTSTDKIILTGGSSRIKDVFEKVAEVAGPGKILMDDNFYDSVSKGLSLYAYYKNISIM
jgi:hypothetical chaperone protein